MTTISTAFALGDGAFDIIVVGTSAEKRYTVKRKHLDRLPL